jgi:serine/threonine protein kinase/WD40 repeat protein
MKDSSSESNLLDQLAEEFVQRCQRGERPSLTEYTARHPELAEEIRDLFPALGLIQEFQPDPGAATGPYAKVPAPATLQRLGDYRILREVGRGGMGIVYEAEQESLGRHVALKVLPAHTLLDAQRLQRFQREARAAARLHHTNIVPVYGVGQQDGLHYYVMQFIQGQALDQVLAELMKLRRGSEPATAAAKGAGVGGEVSAVQVAQALLTGDFAPPNLASRERERPEPPGADASGSPKNAGGPAKTPVAYAPGSPKPPVAHALGSPRSALSESRRHYWQSVARIGIQVADALAYAHAQDTLHRDIKPSNLLLDTHGTVWVTDFGLAKVADSEDLTNTGDVVGTLRYMAPERFQGKSDQRSDLYALGLTLYELLTLRPAFEGPDRNQLMELVKHAEPLGPRKANAEVPRDLETIVLKAMAKEPDHRYATAAELAEDLKRFVEDRPIRARPVGGVERLWRWCRRNPVVAGLTAAVAVLLVAVAVADQQAITAKGHAERAQKAQQQEARERQQAESRLALLYVKEGTQAMDHGDLFGSLPSFLEALKADQNDPRRAEHHRIRLNAVLQQCPRVQFLCHEDPITVAEFSPDGQRIITASARWIGAKKLWRAEVRLWNVKSGRFVTLPHKNLSLRHAAFSTDGARVVTAGWRTLDDRDPFSPKREGEARLWDAITGRPLGPPFKSADSDAFQSGSISPDGRKIVTIQRRRGELPKGVRIKSQARVWDIATGRPVTPPLRYDGDRGLSTAFFCLDGRRVYTKGQRWVASVEAEQDEEQLWETSTGQPVTPVLKRGIGNQSPAEFSASGNRIISGGTGPNGYKWWIWDATSGQAIWCLEPDDPVVQGASSWELSPNGNRLHVFNRTTGLRVWDIATKKPIGKPISWELMSGSNRNGSRLFTVVNSNSEPLRPDLRVWNADTGRSISPVFRPDWPLGRASFSPDGTRILTVSGGFPGEVRVWDACAGRPVTPRLPFEGSLVSASFSPQGGHLLVAGDDGIGRLWDLATVAFSDSPGEGSLQVRHPDLSIDARRAVTVEYESSGAGAKVWDTTTGKAVIPSLRIDPANPNAFWSIMGATFSRDGRYLLFWASLVVTSSKPVATWTGVARVFDAATGRPIASMRQEDAQFRQGTFSPNGRRVLFLVGRTGRSDEVQEVGHSFRQAGLPTDQNGGNRQRNFQSGRPPHSDGGPPPSSCRPREGLGCGFGKGRHAAARRRPAYIPGGLEPRWQPVSVGQRG